MTILFCKNTLIHTSLIQFSIRSNCSFFYLIENSTLYSILLRKWFVVLASFCKRVYLIISTCLKTSQEKNREMTNIYELLLHLGKYFKALDVVHFYLYWRSSMRICIGILQHAYKHVVKSIDSSLAMHSMQ